MNKDIADYPSDAGQAYHAHMLRDMDELIAAIKELTKAVNNLTKSK